MSSHSDQNGRERAAERRAARLISLYPRSWQARYGDEFAALLIDDILERPHSLKRTIDVVRCGTVERLAEHGLAGDKLKGLELARAGTAAVAFSAIPFCLFGLATWSQIAVGWRWASPRSGSVEAGMLLMSAALIGLVAIALLASATVGFATIRALRRGSGRARFKVAASASLALAGLIGLVLGSRHFGHNWPGTGGHAWAWQQLAPARIAGPVWAATLSVTSYWAHPGALGAFSSARIAWMLLSPAAWVALIVGMAALVRQTERTTTNPTASIVRAQAVLGICGAALMLMFTVGACAWVFANPARGALFHPGAINVVALMVLSGAMVLAITAARRAAAGLPAPSQIT